MFSHPGSLRTLAISVLLAALVAALHPSGLQAASSSQYRMDILIDGRPAREYPHRGVTYVEARKGREYSIRITNNSGERVAVALAVDGLNSIDARHTSAREARKWIIPAYSSITVDGWQTSSATARQFYFTQEANSYGAWLGKTRDLGNISAAFFRENYREPVYRDYSDEEYDRNEGRLGDSSLKREQQAPAAAAPGEMRADSSGEAPSERAGASAKKARNVAPSQDLAATGIGRQRHNEVYTVEFDAQSTPAAVITVRYEFRNKLIELGLIPRPVAPDRMSHREKSSGFSDYGYAPDPYRGR